MERFMGSLFFIPLFLVLYIMTFRSTMTFSRASQTVVVAESCFFIPSTTTYALKDVDHAEVAEDDGHSHMLYLALASQDRIPMGEGWTPRDGYFQASNAINVFLDQSRSLNAFPVSGEPPDTDPIPRMEEQARRAIADALEAQKNRKP